MRVLSLFDGISCGRIALDRANIKIEKYDASEIDKHAIKVSNDNYKDIVQLGDVKKVSPKEKEYDLVIGGSPCQGFSCIGTRKGLDDPRSALFFEYVRILKEVKPVYFLLENVVMQKKYIDIITNYLEVEPIKIDSSLVSAQSRKRLYWTNIPGVDLPSDKMIYVKDIITDKFKYPCRVVGRWVDPVTKQRSDYGANKVRWRRVEGRTDNKSNCITSTATDSLLCDQSIKYANQDDVNLRHYTQNELEQLQTLPVGYTSSVKKSNALNLIGNCWTVDVISHILGKI